MAKGWIGYDLDGTLAIYDYWRGPDYIGPPIPERVEHIKQLLAAGQTVKIFTARVCSTQSPDLKEIAEKTIRTWCKEHIGQELEITSEKDWDMIEYYDDRAISIEYNTGKILLENIV